MAKKKAKRKKPRKRADTKDQVEKFVKDSERLLEQWIKRAETAIRTVSKYRKRLAYYQSRLKQMEAVELAELRQTAAAVGREPRAIDVRR